MKRITTIICLLALVPVATAAWFTNSVSVDSFVRAAAPGSNYGGAGALAVAGANAVNASGVANGPFDTFIRFNTAALVANFNSLFGPDQWAVNAANLRVTELGAPNNALFNRGIGAFEIRWIANDSWTEGSGNPTTPATTGITYHDEPALLQAGPDISLGAFTNAGVDGALSFSLALPRAFTADVAEGGEVGLFLTALDAAVGFTFDSRSFGTAAARPYLEISAVPKPIITAIARSGPDVVITAANGLAGGAYYVLNSATLALPLSRWTRVATNAPAADGVFTLTVMNASGLGSGPVQFYTLETK
jgi:hypothetical protein